MKITFLGTGAADWKIENREQTSEFRRYCSALIDDTMLIDPGPHVFDALHQYGKNSSDVKYIICTHRHLDHYCEDTVKS
ncbi:MAG: MBL fold metallo-hydrolase, partial [Clostridia bacterium]|nr:MBL fold metallo-hydrolase [Clostridia bacterium]